MATAGDPAVQEANFRFIGNYDYIHVNSDDVFRFTAPAGLAQAVEVDVDAMHVATIAELTTDDARAQVEDRLEALLAAKVAELEVERGLLEASVAAFPVALLLSYMVLASLFRSYFQPFIVLD